MQRYYATQHAVDLALEQGIPLLRKGNTDLEKDSFNIVLPFVQQSIMITVENDNNKPHYTITTAQHILEPSNNYETVRLPVHNGVLTALAELELNRKLWMHTNK